MLNYTQINTGNKQPRKKTKENKDIATLKKQYYRKYF